MRENGWEWLKRVDKLVVRAEGSSKWVPSKNTEEEGAALEIE